MVTEGKYARSWVSSGQVIRILEISREVILAKPEASVTSRELKRLPLIRRERSLGRAEQTRAMSSSFSKRLRETSSSSMSGVVSY